MMNDKKSLCHNNLCKKIHSVEIKHNFCGSSNLSQDIVDGNFVSSVRSSYSHPDLLVIQHPHFFRSHRSSTLDFHFLSHYSYIKAIMLYIKAITKLICWLHVYLTLLLGAIVLIGMKYEL